MNLCTNMIYPGLPNSTLPYWETTYPEVRSAMAWAHWMWYRWGGVTAYLWLDTQGSHACSYGQWWDNGNEINEIWFRERGISGAAASEYTDHATCFTPGTNRTLASDISINHVTAWTIVQQNTMERCFSGNLAVEQVMVHELGHSYGLQHDESRISVMNVARPQARNCDVASGYHAYPMPDDYQGYLQYHKNYSGTRFNVAGTPWYKKGGVGKIDQTNTPLKVSSLTAELQMDYTIHSYFAHAWGGGTAQYGITFRAIPVNTTPVFDHSNLTWSKPGVLIPDYILATLPGWHSKYMSHTVTVTRNLLPTARKYRIWVYMDSASQVAEVEEADNLFPTQYTLERI